MSFTSTILSSKSLTKSRQKSRNHKFTLILRKSCRSELNRPRSMLIQHRCYPRNHSGIVNWTQCGFLDFRSKHAAENVVHSKHLQLRNLRSPKMPNFFLFCTRSQMGALDVLEVPNNHIWGCFDLLVVYFGVPEVTPTEGIFGKSGPRHTFKV